jgi:fatty acid desaturase
MSVTELAADLSAGERVVRLPAQVIRELSELDPLRSTLRIAWVWLQIILAAWFCWAHFSVPLYLVTVAFIGARQHDIIIVFMHDGAHRRLFRQRALNDWFSELFLAWPFFLFSMQDYRANHFPHHSHLNTERDPDHVRKSRWRLPRSPKQMAQLFVSYLIGLGFLRFLTAALMLARAKGQNSSLAFRAARVIYVLLLLSAVVWLDALRPFALFWMVPFATWLQLVFNLRSMSDHAQIRGRKSGFEKTRTLVLGRLERVFFLGQGPAYFHVEHHMYPSVPFYRLEELHAQLMRAPEYREGVHITHGVLGFLRELSATPAPAGES